MGAWGTGIYGIILIYKYLIYRVPYGPVPVFFLYFDFTVYINIPVDLRILGPCRAIIHKHTSSIRVHSINGILVHRPYIP